MNIKKKFFYLALQVFLALGLIAWLSISIANEGFSHVTNVFEDSKQVQNLQSEYVEPLYYIRETLLSVVIAQDSEFRKRNIKNINLEVKNLDKRFPKLNKEINKVWFDYRILIIKTLNYIDNNLKDTAFLSVTTVGRNQFLLLVDSLKSLQEERLSQSGKTFTLAKTSLIQYKVYLIVTILLISLFTFFIGYIISNNIITSIRKVGIGLEKFFKYLHNPKEKNDDLIISLNSEDELGKMATSINSEIQLVKKELQSNSIFIEEITYILRQIKKNKLNNRIQVDSKNKEFDILKNVINELIDNLEYKIQKEITKRTNQEKLLVQQSKLAEMGNMIGNIAHQWRQPLAEINAILLELHLSAKFNDLNTEYMITQMEECYIITEYMSTTISDFQNFFQPSKEKEMFSILDSCNNAMSIIRSSLKFHNIELSFDINNDQMILGYPNEFSQALLNLLSNAKDALVEREVKNKKIILSVKKSKIYTHISIEDNAGGIKEENIQRVFEPYFTTKHAKQGTGIGLYMTKTIIENNMNGQVSVQNSEKGAMFIIKIK